MSLLTVLDACRQISLMASGVVTAYLNTPESEPLASYFPLTVTRYDIEQRGLITMGGNEYWMHPVEQMLLIRKLGDRPGEDAEVMPFLLGLIAQYRAHASILGLGAIQNDIEYQVGPYTWFNQDFWGAALHFRVEELFDVASEIHA